MFRSKSTAGAWARRATPKGGPEAGQARSSRSAASQIRSAESGATAHKRRAPARKRAPRVPLIRFGNRVVAEVVPVFRMSLPADLLFLFRLFRGRRAGPGRRSLRRCRDGRGGQIQVLAQPRLDLGGELRVLLEELLGVLASLADSQVAIGEPGAGLFHDFCLDPHVDQLALAGDPLAIRDIELRLPEGGSHLVLDDLDLRA